MPELPLPEVSVEPLPELPLPLLPELLLPELPFPELSLPDVPPPMTVPSANCTHNDEFVAQDAEVSLAFSDGLKLIAAVSDCCSLAS